MWPVPKRPEQTLAAVAQVGTVESVWRLPAKSMMGDAFASLPVDAAGVVGDRAWAVRDEVRGGIRDAKKIGGSWGCPPATSTSRSRRCFRGQSS